MEKSGANNLNPPAEQPAPSAAPEAVVPVTVGLYRTASDALQAVTIGFNDWSGKLTDTSLQMGYAVIASDWLIFGSIDGILKNPWAKFSILLIIVALGVNVGGAWTLAELHRNQAEYGDKHPKEWQEMFEVSQTAPSSWPFTMKIELVALWMRRIKAGLTLIGGAFLIIGAVIKAVR